MGTRKLSFRLLLVLTGTAFVLLLALSCVLADPKPTAVYMPYMACEKYNSWDAAKEVWLENYKVLEADGYAVNVNNLWDENGQWIEGVYGIVIRRATSIRFGHYRDPSDRPPGEVTTLRCLYGVPVQTVYDSLFLEPYEAPTPTIIPRLVNTFTLPECTDNNLTRWDGEEILDKYEPLIESYPNVVEYNVLSFQDWYQHFTNTQSIGIWIYPWVDPDTLPEEDRLPDCLEGVPIQIWEATDPYIRANRFTAPECTENNTEDRQEEILDKYESLIKGYPNRTRHHVGRFYNAYGGSTKTWGIVINVYPWVDLDTLPEKDRLPDCLEGVPIQITEGGILQLL